MHSFKIIHRDMKIQEYHAWWEWNSIDYRFWISKRERRSHENDNNILWNASLCCTWEKNKKPSSKGTDIYSFGLVGSFVHTSATCVIFSFSLNLLEIWVRMHLLRSQTLGNWKRSKQPYCWWKSRWRRKQDLTFYLYNITVD